MKVLITATVQSHICQFHRPLVDMLHQQGAEVHVAARNNLEEKNGLSLDFVEKVYDIPFSRSPKSLDNIKAYKQLKQIVDEGAYDVIHCNTPVAGVVTRLACRSARRHGSKVFYTAHGFHFYKGAPWINWIFIYPLEKYLAYITDKIITINTEDYYFVKNKFPCEVVYTHGVGVNTERYRIPTAKERSEARKELGFNSEQPIILCVGELLPNKNQRLAILSMTSVIKLYPDAQLVIAGNGPDKNILEELVAKLDLKDNVRFIGYCTYLEIYQRCATISVTCSKREGLPLNVIEAQLSGVPVIASNNRGHRDLIKNGQTGWIVGCDDIKTMAMTIINLLNNLDASKIIVNNSYSNAKKFTKEEVEKELLSIYEFQEIY